jgi:hypothetical protein
MTPAITLFLVGSSILTFDTPRPTTAAPDPEAQLKTINDEAMRAIGEAKKAVMASKSETETNKIKEKAISTLATLHRRAIELAVRHPRDPVAMKALEWVVNVRGPGPQTPQVASALVILRRDHSRDEGVAPLCENLDQLDSGESEAFLRGLAAENPSRPIQALALYELALLLHHRADSIASDRPQEADRYSREAEQTLARVASTYGREKTGKRTFADRAKTALDEFRRLSVGKPAPIIEGEDADGKRFKLSDYQGKVILLDFWAGW